MSETIIAGYRLAMRESIKYIQEPLQSWFLMISNDLCFKMFERQWSQEHLSLKVDALEQDTLMNIAKTSLSSKFIGSESARQPSHGKTGSRARARGRVLPNHRRRREGREGVGNAIEMDRIEGEKTL